MERRVQGRGSGETKKLEREFRRRRRRRLRSLSLIKAADLRPLASLRCSRRAHSACLRSKDRTQVVDGRSKREREQEKPEARESAALVDGGRNERSSPRVEKKKVMKFFGRRSYFTFFSLSLVLPHLFASFTAQGRAQSATTVDCSLLLSTEPRFCE